MLHFINFNGFSKLNVMHRKIEKATKRQRKQKKNARPDHLKVLVIVIHK